MQITYGFITILFDENISESLAYSFIDNLINPLLALVETAASFFFLAIAIFAFYRIIGADGDEEKIKTWKKSIIYAIVWFVVIKFSKAIVEATYWKLNPDCENPLFLSSEWCLKEAQIEWVSDIIVTIINWVNSFAWLIILIMIIYAGSLVLLSWWDEERIKKAKSILIYIVIWMFLIVANYLILTFFLIPETVI